MAVVTPAGEFRDMVWLDAPDDGTNATGETLEDYRPVRQVRAAVKPLTSRELVRAKAAEVQTTHRVILRYATDVRSTWRIRWADPRGETDPDQPPRTKWRTCRILSIVETVRRRELELSVVEVTDG